MGKNLVFACALALFVSCGTPTIRVHSTHPDAPELVTEAGAILGVPTEMAASGKGVVELEIREPEPPICGRALEAIVELRRRGVVTCEPKAWSCADAIFVAHELGHVFGLKHTRIKGNLMFPAPRQGGVTEGQCAVVEAHAAGLKRYCK